LRFYLEIILIDNNMDNYYEHLIENILLRIDENIESSMCNDLILCHNFILDQQLKPLICLYSEFDNQDPIDLIKEHNWDQIEITPFSLDSKHVCLFYHNNVWYTCYENKLDIVANDKLFCEISKLNLEELDKELNYHFSLKHHSFRKIGSSNVNSDIVLSWVCKGLKLVDNVVIKNISYEKKYYCSCLDELLVSLDMLNNENIVQKRLSYGGYNVRIRVNDYYICCILHTDIYNYILRIMPTHKNQYVNYLELYQNDQLNNILCFIHKYPNDVIKRINTSIKILAKEILNIYHLTRKKQNSVLYDCLEHSHKKILFDLHKIYVDQKYFDMQFNTSDFDNREKRSVTVDIVYDYIKKLKTSELLQIFNDRQNLIDKLDHIKYDYTNILSINNINIITQIKLMSI